MRRTVIAVMLILFARDALAGDGVLEINQTCAVQTGCFAGDTAGFPVMISSSGSYRLTGNLAVAEGTEDGIRVNADGVAIDLAGFEIRGPVRCSGDVCGLALARSFRETGCQVTGKTAFIPLRETRRRFRTTRSPSTEQTRSWPPAYPSSRITYPTTMAGTGSRASLDRRSRATRRTPTGSTGFAVSRARSSRGISSGPIRPAVFPPASSHTSSTTASTATAVTGSGVSAGDNLCNGVGC